MCIKSVLCFHLINANRALNTNIKYDAFLCFDADVAL